LRQELKKLAADVPALQPFLVPLLRAGRSEYVPDRIMAAIDKLAARHHRATVGKLAGVEFGIRQMKALLLKLGIQGEVSGRGANWEVEVPDEKAKKKLEKALPLGVGLGGYRTGYGGWVLSPSYKSMGEFNDPSSRHHYASAVIVGDIFYSQWGYDQTNLDYYQVIKTTPTMVAIRKIEKRLTRGRGLPTEYYMPIANKFVGPPVNKKLKEHGGGAYVNLNSYASAYKWDGKEQRQTGGAYGH
jgi:hypothetical protein